jgi:peptide/nickel transport system substrate-binding protein
MWEQLGVDIEVKVEQLGPWFDRWLKTDFHVMQGAFSIGPWRIDPHVFLYDLWHSSRIGPSGNNASNFSTPELDEALENMNATYDRAERQQFAHEAQSIIADGAPWVNLLYYQPLGAHSTEHFSGWSMVPARDPYTNVWNFSSLEPRTDVTDVVAGYTTDITTLNPMKSFGYEAHLIQKMHLDPLLAVDAQGQPQPWAAADWDVVDDTTIDTFIREGHTWHDGEPFTAEDVKFTMEYYQEWGAPNKQTYYEPIESVEIPEEGTARFNLKRPWAPFVTVNLDQLVILPEHHWDGITDDLGVEHPGNIPLPDLPRVGSGPFTVEKVNYEEELVYNANKEHFSGVSIDRLIFRIYGGKAAAFGAFEKGDAHYIESLQPDQFQRVAGMEGREGYQVTPLGWRNIRFNCQREPFTDPTLRKALNHATDIEKIIAISFDGLHKPGTPSPISPYNEFWHNPDITQYPFDLAKARDMLREAGYRWNDDGKLMRPVG